MIGYLVYPHIKQRLDPYAPLVAKCKNGIRDRLLAPSTYRRTADSVVEMTKISTDEAVGPTDDATLIEKYGKIDAELRVLLDRRRKLYADGGFRHRIIFRYDADNAMGTPIRKISICDEITTSPEPPKGPFIVEVEGETNMVWFAKQAR